MNEDLLRRWARGELASEERRSVTRWIVRCSAPELGPLLHGMTVEARDERLDAELSQQGGVWAQLVAGWKNLLDLGRVDLASPDDAGLVLAALAPPTAPAPIELTWPDDGLVAVLHPPETDQEAALYVSDDEGRLDRLRPPASYDSVVMIPVPGPHGRRTTLWAAVAAKLPRDVDPAAELQAALDADVAQVWAVRVVAE